ncbi:hypothetical protein D5S17_15020 [Pseudonocardiaceae bacterium YIM PH 21723]|nr:hypothetical protein D5S17_15020 [Pseudonocardiaceae bacterium YIM PH 21723]
MTETRQSADDVLNTLFVAAAGGDRVALGRLYDALASTVYGLAKTILDDADEAKAITQDVFLEVWHTDGIGIEPLNARARIVHLGRSRALQRAGSVRRSMGRVLRTVTAAARRTQDLEEFTGLVQAQRDSIILAYFCGLTHREIELALGLPVRTAATVVHSGLMQLCRDGSALRKC